MRFLKSICLLGLIVIVSGCGASKYLKGSAANQSLPKASENRTALVIGNAAYESALLQNAVTDARDMADTLENLGYEVIRGEDLMRREMEKAIVSFGRRLAIRRGVGLFYYAGHAGESLGQNYLFPIDTNMQSPLNNAIAMNHVIDAMKQAKTAKNIIIMDACRERFRGLKTRGAIRGLADMSASMGAQGSSFFIAYSTSPGKFASDSSGYTTELVKFMREASLKIEDVFKKVNRIVFKKTNGRQSPWINYNLTDDFYFRTPDSNDNRTWKDPITGLEFVKVNGGYYSMGCETYWAGYCQKDETPPQFVQVDDFYMSKTEITVAQWNQFLADNSGYAGHGVNHHRACKGPGKIRKGVLRDKAPIICVSWYEANDFAQWLSLKTGEQFSLPTERQWEYACRSGGELEKFSGGYDLAEDVAWYRKNSENRPCHVGLNQPNGLGIYDMTGNVWEWCQDGYDKNAYKTAQPQTGRLSENHPRVLRGGSYYTKEADLRCPNRWFHNPNDRVRNVGFRLVMTPN